MESTSCRSMLLVIFLLAPAPITSSGCFAACAAETHFRYNNKYDMSGLNAIPCRHRVKGKKHVLCICILQIFTKACLPAVFTSLVTSKGVLPASGTIPFPRQRTHLSCLCLAKPAVLPFLQDSSTMLQLQEPFRGSRSKEPSPKQLLVSP